MNPKTRSAGARALEWICCVLLFLIIAWMIYPIFVGCGHHRPSGCLANMNRLSKAILSYCGEYDDYFPCTRAPGVANGMQPERGIDARQGVVPFNGATWVERIDPYIAKGSVEDAKLGIMNGIFNCPEREKKWPKESGQRIPDWHSYGYNFLYLGLPWTKDTAPKTNPYRAWGFTTGVRTVSRVGNTSETVLLVESRSIWAFPPYTNNGRQLAINRTCISPRHNGKVNVAFCDGHCKSMDPTELVTSGRISKNGDPGRAENNWYWDPIKTNYSESSE